MLVACELLLDFFDHALIVLDLLLRVLVCDSFSGIRTTLGRTCALYGHSLATKLSTEASFDELKDGGDLWICLSDICECLHVDLGLLGCVYVTQIGQSFQLVFNL